ncbi:MAG: hypothetical protein ACR2NP_04140 [Pirellulaceae bacterium]
MQLLLAQNYIFANILVVLAVLLGILAVCIPRPRKRFAVASTTKKLKRRKKPS